MPKLKLLREYYALNASGKDVEESLSKNNGRILLTGVMQRADTLNQNGRVYPMPILSREVRNYQKFINENRSVGELDHPPESVISWKNVSHIVRKAYMDGKDCVGTIEVLYKVPAGAILRGLVEHGVCIGISSRGVGDVIEHGDYTVVAENFQLICWDVVVDPSTTNAFMIPEEIDYKQVKLPTMHEIHAHGVVKQENKINSLVHEIVSKR